VAKVGKRFLKATQIIDRSKSYSLKEAMNLLGEYREKGGAGKFDESVEIALNLGVDQRKADQNVRGSVPLPFGLGKVVRVLVFAKGDKAIEAEAAGADFVGSDDLVERIKGGFQDFDSVIATPDMMVQVGKIGKILGPRGLMPSPKVGTVTFDVGATIKSIKAGRVEFKVDKAGIIHAPIGKISFPADHLLANAQALIAALNRAKPSTSKGVYLKAAALSSTMGVGIRVEPAELRLL
jgi:large subunit ribosomal protein L1